MEVPLIKYAVKNILGSSVDELIIVLGYEKEIIEKVIENNKKIKIIYNKDFVSGIASSIKIGLENISKKSESFFISLGNMPDVNQNIYNKLIKSKNSYNKKLSVVHKKEIIIPTFENQYGNPILFSKFMKEKIMKINGDDDTKEVIQLNKDKILNVPLAQDGILLNFNTEDSFKSL